MIFVIVIEYAKMFGLMDSTACGVVGLSRPAQRFDRCVRKSRGSAELWQTPERFS
jgi:hypothetical protein